jgi:hypothetical protein
MLKISNAAMKQAGLLSCEVTLGNHILGYMHYKSGDISRPLFTLQIKYFKPKTTITLNITSHAYGNITLGKSAVGLLNI